MQNLIVSIVVKLGSLECVVAAAFVVGFALGLRLIRKSGCAGSAFAIATAAALVSLSFAFSLLFVISLAWRVIILELDVTTAVT